MADAPSPTRLPKSLLLVAFVQGAAVLVIEVLGARMLTPYFGTSHHVWTAQITVTLVALALGYAVGARLAERRPAASVVRWGLLIAGCSCAVTPLVVERVAYALYRVPLSVAAMLGSLLLFAAPLSALAAVSPSLVGLAAEGGLGAARAAGRISAVGTGGSVVGVLIVAYACIPYLPSSHAMFGLAAVLILSVALSQRWTLQGRLMVWVAVAWWSSALAYELGAQRPPRNAHYREITRAISPYSTLQVWEGIDSPKRALSTNLAFQNYYDTRSHQGSDPFAYVLDELAARHAPEAQRALIIGLGVGIVPRLLAERGVASVVFEIDPVMPELAERYFDADLSAMDLRVGDGRQLLELGAGSYDLILLDAFHGDTTPSHLLSLEAFEALRVRLTERGVVIANFACDPERCGDFLPVVERTLLRAFGHVSVFDSKLGNVYALASMAPLSTEVSAGLSPRVPAALRGPVTRVLDSGQPLADSPGLVLRDDFNPIDYLAARSAERARRLSASAARTR